MKIGRLFNNLVDFYWRKLILEKINPKKVATLLESLPWKVYQPGYKSYLSAKYSKWKISIWNSISAIELPADSNEGQFSKMCSRSTGMFPGISSRDAEAHTFY